MSKFLNISTDNTLGGNSPSDEAVSSQKAIKDYVDNHSSSVSADGVTINTNSSDELQAIGLINKNPASGATNPKYDWVGTLSEYNAQSVATAHPEWICYITDDAITSSNGRCIGEIVTSTIPLEDGGLHLLDGSLIANGAYAGFVDYISGLVTDYPDLFCSESDWQTSVTDYGVCGKFVYDSTNNTVRLPKITGFTEGTTDVTALGNLVEEGLPNITGELSFTTGSVQGKWYSLYPRKTEGAFSKGESVTTSNAGVSSSATASGSALFNASDSNSIYGNSSKVQPQSIKVLYYIVIATSVKTDIEVDIDEVMTDLNGKADVDLSNVNASGTSLASGWGMPSSRYIDLTLGASGSTYTAPANGWFYVNKISGAADKFLQLVHGPTGMGSTITSYNTTLWTRIFIPVAKGDTVRVDYDFTGTTNYFRFIYAEGEPNV